MQLQINLLQQTEMEGLDLSEHQLNLSSSKQKYSFPKSSRFHQRKEKDICESFYDLPTTKTRRSTTMGLGEKNMGILKTNSPAPDTYNLPSDIDPDKRKYNSVAFGLGREKMELQGPLGKVSYFSKMPGPGAYPNIDSRNKRAPSLNSRLPDHEFEKTIKNPGPGTYKLECMGSSNYYISSKFRNFTNGKMSEGARLNPISSKRPSIGPGNYNEVDSINKVGRYSASKHVSASSCVFSRSSRQGLAIKHQALVPGPGQYACFSSFG